MFRSFERKTKKMSQWHLLYDYEFRQTENLPFAARFRSYALEAVEARGIEKLSCDYVELLVFPLLRLGYDCPGRGKEIYEQVFTSPCSQAYDKDTIQCLFGVHNGQVERCCPMVGKEAVLDVVEGIVVISTPWEAMDRITEQRPDYVKWKARWRTVNRRSFEAVPKRRVRTLYY